MPPPRLRLAVGVLSLLALASCSSDDTGAAGDPAATPAPSVSSAEPAPPVQASPTLPPATVAPPPTEVPTQIPTPLPTEPTATATPDPGGPSKALRSVRADVELVAPQLESYYRDREYPVDIDQVRQTLDGSGVQLRPGNSIGGYVYDGDAVEFTLCIENTSGAWATYDTAPMSLRQSGETGGCP